MASRVASNPTHYEKQDSVLRGAGPQAAGEPACTRLS